MTTYNIGRATVNIHGAVDQEKVKAATIKFLKKVERARREKRNEKKSI